MKKIITNILAALALTFTAAAQDTTVTPTSADSTQEQTETYTTEQGMPADAAGTQAIEPGKLAQQADSAYAEDNFSLAEQLYLQAIRQDGTSSTLFYNLGNTYYRQGNLGKAIVNYERALKLDPTNTDASDNLAFVRSKITDRQTDSSSIMEQLWNSIITMFRTNTWAWIAVTLFALFLSGLLLYVFSSVVVIKKISFFGAIIVFLLCFASIIISFAAANRASDNSHAVILPPSAQLSTTPREARTQAEEALLLHEGTKVEIVDSVATQTEGKWYEVAVGTGERAWIKASDVERI